MKIKGTSRGLNGVFVVSKRAVVVSYLAILLATCPTFAAFSLM